MGPFSGNSADNKGRTLQRVKHVLPRDKHTVTVFYNRAPPPPLPPHQGNVFGKYWQQRVACQKKE